MLWSTWNKGTKGLRVTILISGSCPIIIIAEFSQVIFIASIASYRKCCRWACLQWPCACCRYTGQVWLTPRSRGKTCQQVIASHLCWINQSMISPASFLLCFQRNILLRWLPLQCKQSDKTPVNMSSDSIPSHLDIRLQVWVLKKKKGCYPGQ